MEVYLKSCHYILAEDFEEKIISKVQNMKGRFSRFNLDETHAFYPQRSDIKIMRDDVIASIIIIGEMLSTLKLNKNVLSEMGLFVANGTFLENDNKNIKRMMKTLQKISTITDKEERMRLVFRGISPLSALETLTNSATSFIAQYGRIGGNNTTFGNTSYGGTMAVAEGLSCVESNGSNHIMVGGVNGGGEYSALTNVNCYDTIEGWTESACSAFVLMQKSKEDCKVKITKYKHDYRVPSLTQRQKDVNWKQFFDSTQSAEMIIYSGGFTPNAFNMNKAYVDSICNQSFSWNDEYGNLGSASMLMNITRGMKLIEGGYHDVIDLLDYDVYGRETYLQISKV